MDYDDITQSIHFAISTKIGIKSIVIADSSLVTHMGSTIADNHHQVSDSLDDVPTRIVELIAKNLRNNEYTSETYAKLMVVVRWGKVRFADDTNRQVSYVAGVDVIVGGAV